MKEKLEKKNLIIIGIFLVAIVIILLGGALIYNKFFFKKSYSDVENIMLKAAEEYFTKYEEKLPQDIGSSITVTVDTLVNDGEMGTILSYTKDKNVTCDGEVSVTNINGDYRYASILDCGDTYQSQTLVDYIDENVKIVTEGNGLYELNGELVYRGDNVNNYLKFNDHLYRIVKFVDGHPVIIFTDHLESIKWDDRYNIDNDSNSGINKYELSRMKTYLEEIYNDTKKNALLNDSARMMITNYDLPIGRRCNDDTDKTGSLEKASVLTNQYIGLLPVSDFLNASLDKNCNNTVSKSCSNYNYLKRYKYTWWTVTANSKNTYKVYVVDNIASTALANDSAYVRPVFYLVDDAIYVSGDGSKKDPYIVK